MTNNPPNATPVPPPAPRGAQWIDVAEAQKRSGVTDRRIRQLCRDKWQPVGTARVDDAGAWLIRDDADARLARVRFAGDVPFDWGKFTNAQRAQIMGKLARLNDWRDYLKSAYAAGKSKQQATADFVLLAAETPGLRISARTLEYWQRAYQDCGHAGLVDGRWDREAKVRDADPFLDAVKRFYLSKRNLDVTRCHKLALAAAASHGWEPRSYFQSYRYLKSLPKPVVELYRHGEERFVNECEPFIERDYTTLDSNELWCGDHHQFDVMVDAGGGRLVRPWLTAWQDMRSRKILGWSLFAGDPNTDTILTAFRTGCLEHGVPRGVYVDNGKDYDSYALNGRTKRDRWAKRTLRVPLDGETGGVLAGLKVEVQHCWPYHGQSKPIERFFRTLEGDTPVWATYCGNKPGNRPEDFQLQVERGNAPKLSDFIAWFADWLQTHHASAHGGQGMEGKSPDRVFAENLHTKRTASPELLAALLMKRSKPVKVAQNGVRWNGLNYGQFEPALFKLQGKEVVLAIDERDVTSVQVWGIDGKFICIARRVNQKLPVNASGEALRAAVRDKRQMRKLVRDYHQARPRLHEDLPDLITRNVAAESAGRDPDPPSPNVVPVRPALEDQLPALQRAMEQQPLRIAAGAESMSFRELGAALNTREAEPQAPHTSSRFVYRTDIAPDPDDAPAPMDTFLALGRALQKRDDKEAGGTP